MEAGVALALAGRESSQLAHQQEGHDWAGLAATWREITVISGGMAGFT